MEVSCKVNLFFDRHLMYLSDDFFSEILPPECSLLIFSYLTPIDVVNVSQVSKTFFNLIDSRGIWKKAVEYQFGKLNEDHIQQVQQNLLKINWRIMVRMRYL